MTMLERQDIFSSELLSNEDICKLYKVLPPHASELMNEWKRKLVVGGHELRVDMRGKIHRQDYFDATGTQPDPYIIQIVAKQV